ncbi:cyclin-dependent kinase C-2-like [Triticum urartu]|uniref:cyclin-dependent kinase C-2-like n=1 Tax=Triticum urartu TaxID=4572 RepID=UPI0020449115|nr:cyclin-dependent kinase C-2-like [Triticum urartu]
MKPLAIVLKAMDSLPPVLKEFLRPARHPMGQCSGQAPWGSRFLSPVAKTRAKNPPDREGNIGYRRAGRPRARFKCPRGLAAHEPTSRPALLLSPLDCFEKLEQIGEGTYGQVYMAKETETNEIVALKKIRMDNEREGFPITAIREIKILKKLHHQNVIQLKEIVTSPGPDRDEQGKPIDGNKYKGSIYMVFEYMDHDLTGLADRPGMRFTVPQIKCYMKQLLTGLHYCHVNQVLHRDIKGSNLLIDNEGNLKLADFGLARSFSSDHNGNLTNRVITLWYRPPELLLGSTRYGPAVDMWSVGCIFAELLNGKPILPGKNEPEQLTKIFELCGTPDELIWPGVTKMPWYNNFKPPRVLKRKVKDAFKHFDRHALDLLERMLTLDPSQRIPAKEALDAEYFWTDPLPCDPKSLPSYEASHEFQTKKKRQQQRQAEEAAKRQKINHPPPHSRLPPIQHPGQSHQIRPGHAPPVAGGPSHYAKPRGPGGPNRYPQGGNQGAGYNNPNRGGQGSGYGSAPYPQQGRGPPPFPAASGPRGSAGSGYGVGGPNYPPGGPPYGTSGPGRGGPNYPQGGSRNQQQYGSWQ